MSRPPSLLLLHGALGSASHFDALCELLEPEQAVLRPNFPGHGGAAMQGPFSIAAFADSVERFLDKNQVERTDIFGYSLGGYVALFLAWKKPERISRIFTLGTKFEWTPESARRETARLDPVALASKVPAFVQSLTERHAPADWKTVVSRTADLMTDLGNGPDLTAAAWPAIRCPVVIGLGELDTMVGADESRAVATGLPQGRLEILPGTKHPVEQVDMQLLANYLRAWRSEAPIEKLS